MLKYYICFVLATVYCQVCLNLKHKKEKESYKTVSKFIFKIHSYYLVNIKLTISLPFHEKEASVRSSNVHRNINIVLRDPPAAAP